jgi:hypothetical protein
MVHRIVGVVGIGLFLAILLAGCWVASVHPIADPEDRQFDSTLVGVWTDGRDTMSFSGESADNLSLSIVERASDKRDSLVRGSLDLMLTTIGEHKFMGLRPGGPLESMPTAEEVLLMPMYGFARYEIRKDSLFMASMNPEYFERLFTEHELGDLTAEQIDDHGPYLITASTAKIREFFLSHASDSLLFNPPTGYLRVK